MQRRLFLKIMSPRYNQTGYYIVNDKPYVIDEGRTFFGVEAVLGVDYYIPRIPVVVGFDIRPRIFAFVYPYPWDAGLNVRYLFNQHK